MLKKFGLVFLGMIVLLCSLNVHASSKTGYDLYVSVNLIVTDVEPKNLSELIENVNTLGFIDGFIDGLSVGLFKSPHKLNIPASGLQVGQVCLIYKRYAEKNPEKLDSSARVCLFLAIVDAYGWK